jgi:hypothetical protein
MVFDFIKNVVKTKKEEQVLTFVKEDNGNWYIDLPQWKGSHGNLQMVGGADDLLDFMGTNPVTVSCISSTEDKEIPGYFKLRRGEWGLTQGAFYQVEGLEGFEQEIWICPVTLYVLGKYPEFIYLKQL